MYVLEVNDRYDRTPHIRELTVLCESEGRRYETTVHKQQTREGVVFLDQTGSVLDVKLDRDKPWHRVILN